MWLVYLSVLGALGIIGWFWPSGQYGPAGGGPSVTTCIFALGAGVAVFNLLVRDTSETRAAATARLGRDAAGRRGSPGGRVVVDDSARDLRGLTEMRRIRESLVSHFGSLKRRLYEGGRPAAFMRAVNRVDATSMPQASCLRDTRPPWKSSAGAQDGPCPFRSPSPSTTGRALPPVDARPEGELGAQRQGRRWPRHPASARPRGGHAGGDTGGAASARAPSVSRRGSRSAAPHCRGPACAAIGVRGDRGPLSGLPDSRASDKHAAYKRRCGHSAACGWIATWRS